MEKKNLVLIPGTLNDEGLWLDQLSVLADVAECFVPDITKADTVEDMAKTVFATAPKGPLNVVGFSLGGFVAQEMLRQNSETVIRLALLGTDYLPDTQEQALQRKKVVEMAKLPGHFIGIGHQMLKSYLHPSHWDNPQMTKRVQDMTERLGADVLIRQNSMGRKDGTEVLGHYHGPTLIMCGAEDQIRPVDISENMSRLLPQAKLIIVAGAGHLLPIEAPTVVNAALKEWLALEPAVD